MRFRALDGTRRTVRIDAGTKGEADARAVEAQEAIDAVQRLPTPAAIRRALRLDAITETEAAALAAGTPIMPREPTTLAGLALSHPAAQREAASWPRHHERHVKDLRAFCEWSGVTKPDGVTLALVLKYIDHLRAEGYTWDGRRHKLLYLRQAMAIAAGQGFPNPLAGIRLDHRPQDVELHLPSADDLGVLLRRLEEAGNVRALALVGLSFGMGLRPSEIYRARRCDLNGSILSVGVRERKNSSSRRDLPVPSLVLEWLEAETRDSWVTSLHRSKARHGQPMIETAVGQWFKRETGYTTKTGRKTFLTLMAERIELRLLEVYVGHRLSGALPVTTRHYLARAQARELEPVAVSMDELLRSLLSTPMSTPATKPRLVKG